MENGKWKTGDGKDKLHLPFSILHVRHNQAFLASLRGDAAAQQLYEQALHHRRAAGDRRGEAETLTNLGVLAHGAGDHATARRFYHESLAIYRALRYPYGIGIMLNNLAELAEADGNFDAAIALYLHAERLLRDLHSADARVPAEHLQRLTKQLGAKRFNTLRRAGERRGWEEMVKRMVNGQ